MLLILQSAEKQIELLFKWSPFNLKGNGGRKFYFLPLLASVACVHP